MSNSSVKYLAKAANNLGKTLGVVRRQDIIDMVDQYGLVLYRDKYGFLDIINGYNLQTEQFNYLQAPIAYSHSPFWTYVHINRLGFQSTYQNDFEDFEYFGSEIKPIKGFSKWWLTKIMKVGSRDQTR